MVITLTSRKGGCGKTVLAVILAASAAEEGVDVALLDTDTNHAAHRWGVIGAYEFMTSIYAWCGERKLSEVFGRALMDSFDRCPFSEQAKRHAHSVVKDFAAKLNDDIQSYIDTHGNLSGVPFSEPDTCRKMHESKEALELKEKLDLYDQGKIGADAVFRKEDRCYEGPFGL